MATRILIVEDDETLAEMLQLNLELEGYEAVVAHSAEEAVKLNLADFSLVLLDVMLGAVSGFQLARQLRTDPLTRGLPIIFCTARDTEDDMVAGLALGGDDYIFKPYTMRNVLSRIKAVLRRTELRGQTEGLRLDHEFKRCFVDGVDVHLVKKEFEILELLMSHCGRVFTREEILQRVWKGEVVVLDRTIDVNITRIRQKIAPYGNHLITRPGYGYGFE